MFGGPKEPNSRTVVLAATQVRGYAKVWVLGRFRLRLGPRFGGAADPGITPRSGGFNTNPENSFPLGEDLFFYCLVPLRSRPLAIEPPALELQRGELLVVAGERGAEVRIVRRRTVVDGHEVDKVGRGEKRLVNRDLAQARLIRARCYTMCPGPGGAPSQVLIQSVRSGKSDT